MLIRFKPLWIILILPLILFLLSTGLVVQAAEWEVTLEKWTGGEVRLIDDGYLIDCRNGFVQIDREGLVRHSCPADKVVETPSLTNACNAGSARQARTSLLCGTPGRFCTPERILVAQFDENQNLCWASSFAGDTLGSPGKMEADNIAVLPLKDGSSIVVGKLDFSLYLVRVDKSGSFLWEKRFDCETPLPFSANGICEKQKSFLNPYSAAVSNDGTFFVSVKTSFDYEPPKILKFDPDGKVVFQKSLHVPYKTMHGASIAATADGGFFIVHPAKEDTQDLLLVLKADKAGTPTWTKVFPVSAFGSYKAAATKDGGVIVARAGWPDAGEDCSLLLKLDSAGTELWRRTYGKNVTLNDVKEDRDGGIIVLGGRGRGTPEMFIARIEPRK